MNEETPAPKNTLGTAIKRRKVAHSEIGELYNTQENICSTMDSENNRIDNTRPIFASRSQSKKTGDQHNAENIKTVRNHHTFDNSEDENKHGQSNPNFYVQRNTNRRTISFFQMRSLSEKEPNEILLTILDKQSGVVSLLNENYVKPDLLAYLFIVLGKASSSDMSANLKKFIQAVNCNSEYILLHMQQYLVSLRKLERLEENHLDSVLFLTIFLEKFQSVMPSSSSDFMSILSPLLESTCEKCLKVHENIYRLVSEKVKDINEQNQLFLKHHNAFEMRRASGKEKLHLQEPPDSFRSLPVLPTAEDVNLPCSFLRPNLVNGKYNNAEHYLDIQYRLLREDYVKPLRDGISEYLNIKKRGESLRNCKNVRVYSDVCVEGEDFINGDLWHCLKFSDKGFANIQWDRSKRFLTKSLLCLTLDDFKTMLFASVIRRDPEDLKKGLLYIRFEEITDEVLNLNDSMSFVVIETTAYFEAYRHNLMALLQLNEDSLPLKTYIIDVEKKVGRPQYLQASTTFDMRPLFLPLNEKYIIMTKDTAQYEYSVNVRASAKCIKVLEDSSWPTAIDLNLDESQYVALKAAITKEFAIIQGPPGTGKTYIGLRIVQLLLHNLDEWFSKETNSLPILVVCYTNHALDQFLEGLLLFTKKIVRIGGRSSNDKILEYQLQNLKKKASENKQFPRYIHNNIRDTNAKLKNIKLDIDKVKYRIEKCKYVVLSELDLKAYMPPLHFETLISGFSRQRCQKQFTLCDWLGISLDYGKSVRKNEKKKHEEKSSDSFETNRQFDSEDEADIELIEDQRNVDFHDFEGGFSFNKFSKLDSENDDKNSEQSSEDTGWKTQESKKQRYEMNKHIKQRLEYCEVMPEEAAMRVKHVWYLDCESRWQLYHFWLQNFIKERFEESFYLQGKLKTTFQEVEEMRTEEDLFLLQRANIVGLTTNGAAKYRHLVQRLNPMILVVEEAAEILESHIVTSLAPNTRHVILIGDQQQLRPSPTVHMLAVKYDLNISLFERMVLNGIDYCRLSIQHRMRPEIAALLVPHIYSNLENHKVVTEFINIKGVDKSVFFLSHSFNESSESDSKSKVNEYEAKFLIQLCRHLLLQGYEPSQITVLTTYSGQLFALKNLATDEVKKVRFTVVDNFQGEENDIILISFVRSNDEGVIGFLKVPNRVCVALSRAKKGLFCIGNFDLLAEKSILWKNITDTLNSNQSIGPLLRLICQNHPDTYTEVSCEADFKNVPEGGCNRKCEFRLPCGHCCLLMCHLYDQGHEKMVCRKPCTQTCERGHLCERKCFQKCFCSVLIDRTLNKCGHTVKEICGKPENDIICTFDCEKILSCTHQCANRCGEKCGICMNPCIKNCENGHKCEMICSETCYCKVFVDKTLTKCGHVVKEWCGKPEEKIICPLKCQKTLSCGHQCSNKCGETCVTTCKEPCLKFCNNDHQCQKLCFQKCGSCNVLVNKTLERCGHTLKDLCGNSDAYSIICYFKCEKLLSCKHLCFKKCGEDCETMCKEPCLKTCEKGHPCRKVCYKICDCIVVVEKTLVNCGHTVKVPCGKHKEETKCSFKCERKLKCGHYCINSCGETCVDICMQLKESISPLCGHHAKVQCYITDSPEDLLSKSREKLFKVCPEQCKAVLPCSHKCSGTCGKCYQNRLHIPCKEACERILICGHRCQSVCSESCPPCQNPCENKCIHSKCRKTCGKPCRKCTELCEWSCNHKKCTKLCNEMCNRDPCNESCLELLSCGHPCVGMCSEPCPKICRICDNKSTDSVFYKLEDSAKFVLLEDCGHVFEVHGLNRWMIDASEGNRKIRMKTCPACKTVIRTNLRYNYIVKESLFQLERLKKINEFNKKKNQDLQTVLLQKSVSLTSFSYFEPRNDLSKCLSSYFVRNNQELTNIENIISISTGLKSLHFENVSSELSSSPQVVQTLIEYAHITSKWVTDFILKYFLTVSEHQLIQLIYEIHRLKLIGRLLQYVKPNVIESPEFENCSLYLMSYAPFNEDTQKAFTIAFQLLTSKFVGYTEDISTPIEFPYLKTMDMSAGHWYKCSKGHAYCITQYVGSVENYCYECMKKTNEEKLLNRHQKSSKGNSNKFSHYLSTSNWTGAESQTIHEPNGYVRWNQQRENSSWNTGSSTSRHIQPPPEFNYQSSYSRSSNDTSGRMFNSFSERSHSKPSNYSFGFSNFGHSQSPGYYRKDFTKLQGNPPSAFAETTANTAFAQHRKHDYQISRSRPPAAHANNSRRSNSRPPNASRGMSVNMASGHFRLPDLYDNDFQRPHFRPSNLPAGTSNNSSSATRSGHVRNMRRLRGNSGSVRSRSNFK